MQNTESKKSVLMFCANFFGYDKRIAQAIREEGYNVDLVEEKPGTGFVAKTCIRYNIKLYRPIISKYIKSIIEQHRDMHYDYIFVVKGEAINESAIALLRDAYPKAKFILYLWDSVANIPECETRMKLYDKVLSFDPVDAKKYGIFYLPIPYGKEHIQCQPNEQYDYDMTFVGTAHSVRPRVVSQLQEQCKNAGLKSFIYFYSPHILVFLLNKILNRDYKWMSLKDVHFSALSQEEVCRIYSSSKCVLDIEHPKQQGATTRPIEMLPMRKKIITTNHNVKKFDFYNENNFCIINRDAPEIDISFFEKKYEDVPQEIIDRYSPPMFVKNCFTDKKS